MQQHAHCTARDPRLIAAAGSPSGATAERKYVPLEQQQWAARVLPAVPPATPRVSAPNAALDDEATQAPTHTASVRVQVAAYPQFYEERKMGCEIPTQTFSGHATTGDVTPVETINFTIQDANSMMATTWMPGEAYTVMVTAYSEDPVFLWVHASEGAHLAVCGGLDLMYTGPSRCAASRRAATCCLCTNVRVRTVHGNSPRGVDTQLLEAVCHARVPVQPVTKSLARCIAEQRSTYVICAFLHRLTSRIVATALCVRR